ncbi:MAG: dehydrogenase [Planctomycetaceae bacterium]|nr:dehydrogenase [Planctomycetaceae bacterium]
MIGTGFMGWVHVEALRRIGVRVVGICGSTPAKSDAAAKQLGLGRGYQSFDDVLNDDEVHSIHIGTPNRSHFEMAKRVLEAGKHVLCEKPLAMTSDESSQLVRISAEHPDLAAGVNYNIRFNALCQEARQRIQDGDVGNIFHINGSYVQDWLIKPTDYNWRVLASEGGDLRAVSDIGTHWLDLIQRTTGLEVEAVFADLYTVYPTRQRPMGEVATFSNEAAAETEAVEITTEDYGAILLRFQGGARGTVHVSQVTAGRKNCLRFEIAGSKKSLYWNSESPNELWIGHRDEANELLMRDPALLVNAADYPGGHNEGYADSFKYCFRAFYEYIARGDFSAEPTFPTFADGHREIVLCEAILQSHQTGSWVEV